MSNSTNANEQPSFRADEQTAQRLPVRDPLQAR